MQIKSTRAHIPRMARGIPRACTWWTSFSAEERSRQQRDREIPKCDVTDWERHARKELIAHTGDEDDYPDVEEFPIRNSWVLRLPPVDGAPGAAVEVHPGLPLQQGRLTIPGHPPVSIGLSHPGRSPWDDYLRAWTTCGIPKAASWWCVRRLARRSMASWPVHWGRLREIAHLILFYTQAV